LTATNPLQLQVCAAHPVALSAPRLPVLVERCTPASLPLPPPSGGFTSQGPASAGAGAGAFLSVSVFKHRCPQNLVVSWRSSFQAASLSSCTLGPSLCCRLASVPWFCCASPPPPPPSPRPRRRRSLPLARARLATASADAARLVLGASGGTAPLCCAAARPGMLPRSHFCRLLLSSERALSCVCVVVGGVSSDVV
jgi:hypothetical protein